MINPGVFGKIGVTEHEAGAALKHPPAWPHDVRRSFGVSTVRIPLTHGKVALVDSDDAERVNQHLWFAAWERVRNTWTARMRGTGSKTVYLHRFLLNVPTGVMVDHKNGNTLDCRRSSNLRTCNRSQNSYNARARKSNTCGFKGVSPHGSNWRARIRYEKKLINLGTFDSPEEAALAYDAMARALHGDFASCNFPIATERIARRYLAGLAS